MQKHSYCVVCGRPIPEGEIFCASCKEKLKARIKDKKKQEPYCTDCGKELGPKEVWICRSCLQKSISSLKGKHRPL